MKVILAVLCAMGFFFGTYRTSWSTGWRAVLWGGMALLCLFGVFALILWWAIPDFFSKGS